MRVRQYLREAACGESSGVDCWPRLAIARSRYSAWQLVGDAMTTELLSPYAAVPAVMSAQVRQDVLVVDGDFLLRNCAARWDGSAFSRVVAMLTPEHCSIRLSIKDLIFVVTGQQADNPDRLLDVVKRFCWSTIDWDWHALQQVYIPVWRIFSGKKSWEEFLSQCRCVRQRSNLRYGAFLWVLLLLCTLT